MIIKKVNSDIILIKERNLWVFAVGLALFLVGIFSFISPGKFIQQPSSVLKISFVVSGLLVFIFTKMKTIVLDKTVGKMTINRKALIGSSKEEYNLKQVKSVELRQEYGKKDFVYNLFFIMGNNNAIRINETQASIRIMEKSLIPEGEGLKIAQFLNIPFEQRRAPTTGEVLSEVKEIISEKIEETKK
jgi:hypothetical protein